MDNAVDLRKHFENHVPFADPEFEEVLKYFKFRTVKKNTCLIRAGDSVHYTYWVKKGLLVSTYTHTSGKEHIVQFAIESCWITDQDAYYNQGKASFNLMCLEDSELFFISYDNREKLCSQCHKIEHYFRKRANHSFAKQQKRLLTYLSSDASERYNLLLKEYPGIAQRLSKKVLAAYLGVTRETLSRLKA